ncbi:MULTISPECIES: SAM-dependent DNA methyltransferase [unclassified Pasteurella]|uniref:SAM-dependent DNA methyltransferase n=1 Tax=unclassified Pasteurella TaxID=2621516 RepID=UPI001073408F|nr:SAM-dependent DNA methyltransferase [Pasteurella sp. 19428wF3_WM03]TFU50773.1 SAM-dependent DNA methyltransferase [Pasteurella sp. WM03]
MQVKSKQRVADFGEVYTNEREVNAMLDLVNEQTTNPDKTFLEPACGTGNFLVEILRRKLTALSRKYKKLQFDYERYAVIAVGSLYGIDIQEDNVKECRQRLFECFTENYQRLFPKTYKADCIRSVEFILNKNILCGDALSLKTSSGQPIIFSEWKLPFGNEIKRRDFVYRDLVENLSDLPLFSDKGEQAFIPEPIRDYSPIHFLELGKIPEQEEERGK